MVTFRGACEDAQMDVTVVDNPEQNRFEARTPDGQVAGYAEYSRSSSSIMFTHTRVEDAFGGHGIGSKLVAGALDQVRERGLAVIPRCSFVRGYIDRHPEYADLVRTRSRSGGEA